MAGTATVEKLRIYLAALSPKARSLLISELERAMLRGDDMAGAGLVLQELRLLLREDRNKPGRVDPSARYLFKPLEPFLVDDRADHKHSGRIARAAVEPLWTWIGRDLLPDETKDYTEQMAHALIGGDQAKADAIARVFQDQVGEAIDKAFSIAENERLYRRVLAQIGTPRAHDDAMALKSVLKGRDALEKLGSTLPARIPDLGSGQLENCKALIDNVAQRGKDLFVYSLLTVMNRLNSPWQIIRLGVKAAGSDTAARVAETPYGVSVNIVLAELERQVGELRTDLRAGQSVGVGALLKTIHDSARGLRTELDLPVDSTWGRSLATQRAQIAELLRTEIESMPGRVRRLLRPPVDGDIRPGSVIEPREAAETEGLVEFVGSCRYFASELALNEMTQRAISELQQVLDRGTRVLLEALKLASPDTLPYRQSQVDAAVRLCAKVFGKDYAVALQKAAEQVAPGERKSARA